MVYDAALLEELGPDLLRESEVRGVIAVQVADLAPPDREGELAAAARPGLDTRPRGDLTGYLLARCHGTIVRARDPGFERQLVLGPRRRPPARAGGLRGAAALALEPELLGRAPAVALVVVRDDPHLHAQPRRGAGQHADAARVELH